MRSEKEYEKVIIYCTTIIGVLLCSCGNKNHNDNVHNSKEEVEYYVFSDERGNEGYIDKKGNVVINPQFDYANKFSEGLAAVKIGDKWGYVDKMGKYVINPQFDRAGDFSEGRAAVMMGDKWGYVNKTGKLVINPQFKFADDFLGGWAFVSYESQENENGFRQGYIDKTGASVYTFVSK